MKTYHVTCYTIIVATIYATGWIAAVLGLVPSSDLNKQSLHCSITEYTYPVMPGLDISWLSYCQQVYGDVLLETSFDNDHSSIIADAFIVDDSDALFTNSNRSNTTSTAMTHSSTSTDGVVVPSGDETNNTTSSADSRRSSSISNMSDYLRLARIAQSTRQHVNLYYENTSVKILPLDWTYDSKTNNIIINDSKR